MSHEPTAPSRPGHERLPRRPAISAGDAIEARVAQLWFWEGFYSRNGVDLTRQFHPEPLQVTDLDLLAFDFNPHLARSKYIGEVKTGTGRNAPRPLDRIIWLRGLRELVEANSAELTIAHAPTERQRELARSMGIVAQSIQDFERREQQVVGNLADYGAHGIPALEFRLFVRDVCKQDLELERAYWFLRSGVWFLDPFTAVKQIIDVLRRIKHRWAPQIHDDETLAYEWITAEGTSILALNLVTISGLGLTLDRGKFFQLVSDQLAEGIIPMHQMRRISESVDKYVAGLLDAANAQPDVKVKAMGALLAPPPDWAEPLAEIAWRMRQSALTARSLPRQMDLLLHERLVHAREPALLPSRRIGLDRLDGIRLRKIIAAFLRGCDASSEALDAAITSPFSHHQPEATASSTSSSVPDQESLVGQTQHGDE